MPTRPEHTTMPLGDHLEELRKRVVVALLGLVPILGASLFFGKSLLGYLIKPAEEALQGRLTALGTYENFSAYMKVCLIAAIVIGSPWILYQLWLFVKPGLYSHERRYVYFLVPLSTILTGVGVVFLYKVVMPLILAFFISFGSDISLKTARRAPLPPGVTLARVPVLSADPPDPEPGDQWINTELRQLRFCVAKPDAFPPQTSVESPTSSPSAAPGTPPDSSSLVVPAAGKPVIHFLQLHPDQGIEQQIRVSDYVDLLFTLTIAFAITFQTPVVVLLLGWSGFIDLEFLKKYRRHAVIATLALAAVISPGDPTSLILIWIPLILLYEFGGLLLRLFPPSRVSGVREGDDDAP